MEEPPNNSPMGLLPPCDWMRASKGASFLYSTAAGGLPRRRVEAPPPERWAATGEKQHLGERKDCPKENETKAMAHHGPY